MSLYVQEYFQQASDALYTATKRFSGRYFGEVTIFLPINWPLQPNAINATTESVKKATFSIEPNSPAWGSNPHTIRLVNDCGSLGEFTVLPESFVRNKTEAQKFGSNIGKIDLHSMLTNSQAHLNTHEHTRGLLARTHTHTHTHKHSTH